jgi:hypothetical protein
MSAEPNEAAPRFVHFFSRACQAASTFASRSAAMPAFSL